MIHLRSNNRSADTNMNVSREADVCRSLQYSGSAPAFHVSMAPKSLMGA